MDVRQTWTDRDEVEDYVVPNVLSPRDLVSRPDNMDETILHTYVNYANNKDPKWWLYSVFCARLLMCIWM